MHEHFKSEEKYHSFTLIDIHVKVIFCLQQFQELSLLKSYISF